MFKAGQIAHIAAYPLSLRGEADWSEKVTIRPWRKVNGPKDGPISPATGWNVVHHSDGGELLCHDSRLMLANDQAA